MAQQPGNRPPADNEHERQDCGGLERAQADADGQGPAPQVGDDGNHRDKGEVLDHEHPGHHPAVQRTHLAPVVEDFEHDHGARQRDHHTHQQRLLDTPTQRPADRVSPGAGEAKLRESRHQNPRAEPSEVARRYLDAHGEQQEHNAQLGEGPHGLDVAYQAQDVRPDDDADAQVAEHGRQADSAGHRPASEGRDDDHDDVPEQVRFHGPRV